MLPQFWRALWLSVCLICLSKQWGDMDQLLPPFLERHFGVGAVRPPASIRQTSSPSDFWASAPLLPP